MPNYHIAQVNIGRIKAQLDDPLMHGFVSRLDELNALADSAPGFIWRLQSDAGNATYFRPWPDDDRMLLNMSVWESIDSLKHYVYKSAHAKMLPHRHLWFERLFSVIVALWWVPAGHRPSIDEAKKSASPILTLTALRNSPSPSKPSSLTTTSSSSPSTTPPSSPARLLHKEVARG